MTFEGYEHWGASIIPAAGSFILNAAVRGKGILKSSGADWLLIIFAFDLTSIISLDSVKIFVPDPSLRESFKLIMITCLIITLGVWMAVVIHFEPILALPVNGRRDIIKKYGFFIASWLIILALTASHIYLFVYKK